MAASADVTESDDGRVLPSACPTARCATRLLRSPVANGSGTAHAARALRAEGRRVTWPVRVALRVPGVRVRVHKCACTRARRRGDKPRATPRVNNLRPPKTRVVRVNCTPSRFRRTYLAIKSFQHDAATLTRVGALHNLYWRALSGIDDLVVVVSSDARTTSLLPPRAVICRCSRARTTAQASRITHARPESRFKGR